jgi:hypothetical protein
MLLLVELVQACEHKKSNALPSKQTTALLIDAILVSRLPNICRRNYFDLIEPPGTHASKGDKY